MEELFTTKIQTVTEITKSIKVLLETGFSFITVVGQISNLRIPHSGHIYFTLKDQESQLKAVMFKPQQRYLTHMPQEGHEVLCRGRISVYEPRGEYQLIVDVMDPKGIGELQLAFDRLKKKLSAEGLFDEANKKRLPFLPQRITLVTSPTGAAIHDFLKAAGKRASGLSIEIFPVRVQGDGAASDIVSALKEINERNKTDVIILCRGGGSIEDLWPFNEETVARAIFASTIPTVSAIGHEIDYTISDFVADLRAPTPTAAAELVIPDQRGLSEKINSLTNKLLQSMRHSIDSQRIRLRMHRRMLGDPSLLLSHFHLRLDHTQNEMIHVFMQSLTQKNNAFERSAANLFRQNPKSRLVHLQQWAGELSRKLHLLGRLTIERKKTELQRSAALLDAVSPLAVLGRGYSITRLPASGEIITSAEQVKEGDEVNILLHKGELYAEITKAERK